MAVHARVLWASHCCPLTKKTPLVFCEKFWLSEIHSCYHIVIGKKLLLITTWLEWLGFWKWRKVGNNTVDFYHGKSYQLLFVLGFSNFCGKFSYQPCYWCLPWSSLWRQPGGGPGYSNSLVRHLFYSCCCTRIAAREDEASILGSTHFMGTGWPFCSKLLKYKFCYL